MNNIAGKVVVITGASSGIGAETARVLAANGAKVVLSARREERLRELAAEIGENAAYLRSDVSSLADMQALAAFARQKYGKIDALFANAGIMPAGNMSELKTDDWARMVRCAHGGRTWFLWGGLLRRQRYSQTRSGHHAIYRIQRYNPAGEPATFACVGDADGIANWRTMQRRIRALDAMGVPTEFHVYEGLGHGFGLGAGTAAEGWLSLAAAFWENNM